MLQTGYFGSEKTLRPSKVHVFNTETRRADCGAAMGPNSHFNWCAHGVYFSYLTCETCRRRENERALERAAAIAATMRPTRRSARR